MKTKLVLITLSLLGTSAISAAAPKNLDELLNQVKVERVEKSKVLSQREKKFVSERNTQKQELAKKINDLRALQAITKKLQNSFEANEKQLTDLY